MILWNLACKSLNLKQAEFRMIVGVENTSWVRDWLCSRRPAVAYRLQRTAPWVQIQGVICTWPWPNFIDLATDLANRQSFPLSKWTFHLHFIQGQVHILHVETGSGNFFTLDLPRLQACRTRPLNSTMVWLLFYWFPCSGYLWVQVLLHSACVTQSTDLTTMRYHKVVTYLVQEIPVSSVGRREESTSFNDQVS